MNKKISNWFTIDEVIHSDKAISHNIPNIPTDANLVFIKSLAINCLDPLRDWYGKPIGVNIIKSWFRCPKLNTLVGGDKASDHKAEKGSAIDLNFQSISENKRVFEWIKNNLDFDQLIWEKGGIWIHLSYRSKKNNRKIESFQ